MMRLVVTSDTHYPVPKGIIPDGDVFIHAGDLMDRGYPDEWQLHLNWLNELPHKIKLYVPGNHDFHMQNYPGPALQDLRKAGVTVIGLPGNSAYNTYNLPNGMRVLGCCHITDLPRWAFSCTEEDISAYMVQYELSCPNIVVSHQPIHGVLDVPQQNDPLGYERHTGSTAYREFFRRIYRGPKYWFHGHIHEQYGQAQIDDTTIYNVAMCDREYKQVNPPVVIDIEDRK